MTFLQNLWRDLVDKRLWPVAIVLVVAAVAVPFLIGGGSSSQDVAAAGTAAPGPAAADGEVSVVAGPDGQKVDRSGKSRDPFKPLVYAKTPKTAAAAGAATGTTTTTGKATTGGTTGSKQSVTPTTPKANTKTTTPKTKVTPKKTPTKSTTPKKSTTTATPSRTSPKAYRLAVSIRQSGSTSTATRTGLRAGSYLPSRDNALLVFLGVRRDGKTASFHVAYGVDVIGKDRKCSQGTATHCRTLEMRPGDSVRLDTTPLGGAFVTSYRFRVIKVTLVK